MKKLQFLLQLFMIISIYSCNKDSSTTLVTQNLVENRYSDGDHNWMKEKLAEELSCLITNYPMVLQIFNNSIIETFHSGHYELELFWNLEKDISRIELNGNSLSDLLIQQNAQNNSLLNAICINIPALTILQVGTDDPINPTGTFSSKIYYDDDLVNNNQSQFIKYFENCIKDSVTISNVPSNLSFVIRVCETYISPIKLSSERHLKTTNPSYNRGTSCENPILLYGPDTGPNGPGPDGPPNPGCHSPCERDCIDGTDMLSRLRARNDYDWWWKGTGEFLFHFIWANNVDYEIRDGKLVITGGSLDYVIKRVDGVKDNDQFMHPRLDIFNWNNDTDGDRIKCVLLEEDHNILGIFNDTKIKLKFKVYGVEVEFETTLKFSDNDDFIGENIIQYCQPIDPGGFEYKPSTDVDYFLGRRIH